MVHCRQRRQDPLRHLCPARQGDIARNHRMDRQYPQRQDDHPGQWQTGEIRS